MDRSSGTPSHDLPQPRTHDEAMCPPFESDHCTKHWQINTMTTCCMAFVPGHCSRRSSASVRQVEYCASLLAYSIAGPPDDTQYSYESWTTLAVECTRSSNSAKKVDGERRSVVSPRAHGIRVVLRSDDEEPATISCASTLCACPRPAAVGDEHFPASRVASPHRCAMYAADAFGIVGTADQPTGVPALVVATRLTMASPTMVTPTP